MKRAILAAVALLAAGAAEATYVVLLKNGARVVARAPYELRGSNALVTLQNGTLTSIPLSLVDVEATEKLNARNLGSAVPLDWVDSGVATPPPTPTPTPSVARLGQIRAGLARPENDAALPTPTPGISLRDRRYPDVQVQRTFEEGLDRYHLYLYRMSQGSQPRYLFVELRVNGQAEVLKSLQAVATTYHLLAQEAPDRAPEKLELQMLNEAGREAGLFRITAAEAGELARGAVTAEDFFLQKVIF